MLLQQKGFVTHANTIIDSTLSTMVFQIVPLYPWAILGITGIITLTLLIRFISNKRVNLLLEKFPGPYRYPIVDNALEFNVPNDECNELAHKFRKKYGDRYRIKVGHLNFITLANPNDVEKLLTSSVHIEKGQTYNFLMPWLGEGLLTSKGKKWQKRRKMITPSFHFKILEDFLIMFNEQSQILIDIVRKDFENGQEQDICTYLTRCALDIIGETAMDRKFGSQRDGDTPYVKALYKACEVVQYKCIRPWCWIGFIFDWTPMGREFNAALKVLHDFTDKVIEERKMAPGVNKLNEINANNDDIYWHGKRRLAFLDLLLDAQKIPENNLSDRDIREEVDTFMFEGHDTTAASLGWVTFLLGCNQEQQAKVHEELDTIFGDDRTRSITTKDLHEMKYLEMCIKEGLRLYPSVPFLSRSLTSDLVLDDEFTIPGGSNVVLMTLPIHRNEKIFPNAEKFDPDRFLPENSAKRHPFAYIPFSAGPRNCIGQKFAMMEEKVVLANLFRNFKVEAAEKLEDVTVMIEVITRPKNGLKVRLIPR